MKTLLTPLVLADITELLQAAVPIIFMILYGIAQLVGGKQAAAKRNPAPRPRPAPPEIVGMGPLPRDNPADNAAGKPPSLEETLRREVEDFLKRAQGQSPPQKAPARPQPSPRDQRPRPAAKAPAARRPLRTEPKRPATPRRISEPLRPAPTPSTLAPPLSTPPAQLGSSVARHVAEHMQGAKSIVDHAQQLGADVAQADERMEQHLKERFVHKLGSLAPETTTAVERRPATSQGAQDLLTLLTRPGGARQAVIIGEILRRPEGHW